MLLRCLDIPLEDGLHGELKDAVNTRLLLLDFQHTDVVFAVSSIAKLRHDYKRDVRFNRNLIEKKQ